LPEVFTERESTLYTKWARVTMFNYPGEYYEIIRASFRDTDAETSFLTSFLPHKGNVLDLGCGTGTNLRSLAKLGHQCVGVDQSEQFIEWASAKSKHMDENLKFFHAEMHEFESDLKFDLVMSLFVALNYVCYEKLPLIFENVKSHLNPDGVFIIDIGHMLNFVEDYRPYIIAHHSQGDILITRWITHTIKPHKSIWKHNETLLVNNAGKLEMYHECYEQQVLKVNELKYMLNQVGFISFEEYGWWDKREPIGSGHLILVAKLQ
jgi:cyclopropane fatty-acyl-phospholipid synthase-like methyltransferase